MIIFIISSMLFPKGHVRTYEYISQVKVLNFSMFPLFCVLQRSSVRRPKTTTESHERLTSSSK